MKGGLAAMIDVATRLAVDGGLETGRLVVAAVADEENASLGADALVRNHAADGAVVTEPTDLAVATGTKDSSGSKSRPAVGPPTAAGRTKGATPSYAWAGSWPG